MRSRTISGLVLLVVGISGAALGADRTTLADAGIQAIYVTQYRRTQDTARPLAEKLNLKALQTPPSNEALAIRLKSQHPNDVVLMVGHSNTIPAIIKALGGPGVTIADNEFDNLFVLAPASKAFTRFRFSPAP